MISDAAIDRIATREAEAFRSANPRSMALADRASASWFQGVPFHWMLDWPSPVPLVAAKANDATLTTVDGQTLDPFSTQLETLIKGVFAPQRLLDILRYFVVFEHDDSKLIKKVAGYHQYYAVNKAVDKTVEASRAEGDQRGPP